MASLIGRRIVSGHLLKITAINKPMAEEQMRIDETTAYQLHHLLTEKGYSISFHTIFQCRFNSSRVDILQQHLPTNSRSEHSKQVIIWAKQYINYSFNGVIGTDECTVQIESDRVFACRKCSEPRLPKPRCGTLPKVGVSLHKPKHLTKVYGISK